MNEYNYDPPSFPARFNAWMLHSSFLGSFFIAAKAHGLRFAACLRWFSVRWIFRNRMFFGVISTSSPSAMNSRANSSVISRGGVS